MLGGGCRFFLHPPAAREGARAALAIKSVDIPAVPPRWQKTCMASGSAAIAGSKLGRRRPSRRMETSGSHGRKQAGRENRAVQGVLHIGRRIGWPARVAALIVLVAAIASAPLGAAAIAGFLTSWSGFTLRARWTAAGGTTAARLRRAPLFGRRGRRGRRLFGRRDRRPVEVELLDRRLDPKPVE